jgi:hypothetical protein
VLGVSSVARYKEPRIFDEHKHRASAPGKRRKSAKIEMEGKTGESCGDYGWVI